MITAKWIRFFPVYVLAPIFLTLWCPSEMVHADNGYRKLINCDLHDEACTDRIGNMDIRLDVTPKPIRAMRDLVFTVTLSGNGESSLTPPVIDLSMPGMDMGPNRVKMKSVGKNLFEGKGVIVKCPSGHRVWKATVMVPHIGQAEFIFDVIY